MSTALSAAQAGSLGVGFRYGGQEGDDDKLSGVGMTMLLAAAAKAVPMRSTLQHIAITVLHASVAKASSMQSTTRQTAAQAF